MDRIVIIDGVKYVPVVQPPVDPPIEFFPCLHGSYSICWRCDRDDKAKETNRFSHCKHEFEIHEQTWFTGTTRLAICKKACGFMKNL